jgi:hypothetical protein
LKKNLISWNAILSVTVTEYKSLKVLTAVSIKIQALWDATPFKLASNCVISHFRRDVTRGIAGIIRSVAFSGEPICPHLKGSSETF